MVAGAVVTGTEVAGTEVASTEVAGMEVAGTEVLGAEEVGVEESALELEEGVSACCPAQAHKIRKTDTNKASRQLYFLTRSLLSVAKWMLSSLYTL